jgi:2-polyprenyl-3-methyl-5-hydroxy-6-metoxy-1,4-benzoquinol methylase
MNEVKEFYDRYNFPGPYTFGQIKNYPVSLNKYLRVIDQYIDHNQSILDVGCGTGLITNILALRYFSTFTGIDFSSSADWAKQFIINNNIPNVEMVHADFFNYIPQQQFNVIIAQSFLTHVADYKLAIERFKELLLPGGVAILGVYNPWGNTIKKYTKINYKNDRLALDQINHPFEITISHKEMLSLWEGYELLAVTPSINKKLVDPCNLLNGRNGGLTLYVFRK